MELNCLEENGKTPKGNERKKVLLDLCCPQWLDGQERMDLKKTQKCRNDVLLEIIELSHNSGSRSFQLQFLLVTKILTSPASVRWMLVLKLKV